MQKNGRTRDIVLGLFVGFGILALFTTVLLIGKERRLFESTVVVETHFPNVGGLAIGADVMLAGSPVGHVSAIRFPILRADMPTLSKDVTVVMEISERAMPWIREDSLARIDSKGLLGDKIINVDIGSPALPEVQKGGTLGSTPPIDLNRALQQAQEVLSNVTETVADAREIFRGFVKKGGDEALANSAKSLSRLFKEIEQGKGAIHALIYDQKGGKETITSLTELRQSLENINKLTKNANDVMHHVKNGPGLANSLIFAPEGAKISQNLNKNLTHLQDILAEIKNGDSVIHGLLYDKDHGNFIANLNRASKNFEDVSLDLKEGRGSLGLLLKDPSLYNQLSGLLFQVNRSRILKAVIQRNISRFNEAEKP